MLPVVVETLTLCSKVTALDAPTGVTPEHSGLMIMAPFEVAVGCFTVGVPFVPSHTVTLTAGASIFTAAGRFGSTAAVLLVAPTIEGSLALQSPAKTVYGSGFQVPSSLAKGNRP